jgi:hypothetical protein
MSEKVVWQMLKTYVTGAGLPDIAPHHLRRTTAKLCRAAGGELEQIQLLGHSSVETTERYLGTKEDLVHAPNDAIRLKLAVWCRSCGSPCWSPVPEFACSDAHFDFGFCILIFLHFGHTHFRFL